MIDMYYNSSKLQKDHAQWKKPQKAIYFVILLMWNLQNSQISQTQSKLVVPRGWGREGNGTPLQYSCLENPMDRGAWQAAIHGVTKSQIRLIDFTFTSHFMQWRRKWQPTPLFLPGESQGQWSLVDKTEVMQQQQGLGSRVPLGVMKI